MTQRLTREFLKTNTVAFFPSSMGEALYIQQRLNALGIRWVTGEKQHGNNESTLKLGIIVHRGQMYLNSEDADNSYIVADVRALSPYIDAPTAALEARVAELEKQVADLTAALKPTKLEKPASGLVTRKPGQGG